MVANRSVGTGLVASAVVSVRISHSPRYMTADKEIVMAMEYSSAQLRPGYVLVWNFWRILVWSWMYTVCWIASNHY